MSKFMQAAILTLCFSALSQPVFAVEKEGADDNEKTTTVPQKVTENPHPETNTTTPTSTISNVTSTNPTTTNTTLNTVPIDNSTTSTDKKKKTCCNII
ncbi:hypothetical protein Bealeia1_00136 [Candidatus Bealeia paramacronuclearis]|uniref:Uncharacterized protein n=1 Tax=Candidatus Bealeia paramacronuclearis TaxID=1921001 RepID=A0ABZ2C0H7_9PROT|nr:hypothetical protein [Candidatus Bealeia paramacronuclearis]